MDTSEIYVKMADCKEVQKVCYLLGQSGHDFFYDSQKGIYRGFSTASSVWLPMQSQIQGLFKEKPFVLSKRFDEEMENYITDNPDNWSFEMLWLAYFMFKKHQKIWSPKEEKWVKK